MPAHNATDINQTSRLSEVTLAALQIQLQPFDSAAPEWDVHADDISIEQLADVRQALVSGDDLLLILGEAGAGKTVLLDQLGMNSGQNIQCFAVRGSPRFSTMNLFAGMLEAFKRSPPDQLMEILDDLIPCLQTMVARQTLSAIILDDADQISEDELTRLLSGMLYINSQNETLIRVALSAPPGFEERIPDLLPESADLPYSSLAIEGMDIERTADFIDFHLKQAGYEGELPFTDDDLSQIVHDSGGLPGAIKSAAATMLNRIYDPGAHPAPIAETTGRSGAFLQSRQGKLLLGAAAVAMILSGLLMFGSTSTEKGNSSDTTVGEATRLETQTLGVEDVRGLNRTEQKSDTDDRVNSRDESPELTTAESADSDSSILRIDSPPESLPNLTEAIESLVPDFPVTPPSAGNNDETGAGASAAAGAGAPAGAPADTSANADNASSSSASIDSSAADPTESRSGTPDPAPSSEEPGDENIAGNASETTTTGVEDASSEVDDTTASVEEAASGSEISASRSTADAIVSDSAPDVDPELADILESPTWILVQDATLTTVQMSASRDRPSIENFLKRNRDALPPPNSIYSFERNGETWFALLNGLYSSFEDAQRAVEAMPAAAVTDQPWIRNVGRVQDILKAQ